MDIQPASLHFTSSETFRYGGKHHHIMFISLSKSVYLTSKEGYTWCVFTMENIEDGGKDVTIATFRGEFLSMTQALKLAEQLVEQSNVEEK